MHADLTNSDPSAIAVIGMAGRFPGAENTSRFWNNLRNGVESITPLTDEELLRSGADPLLLKDSSYVKASAILGGIDMFDAAFFGFSPRDAAIMDPQHRIFLECAWEALEDAGWSPDQFPGSIGVYAGSGMNSYLIFNLLPNQKLMKSSGLFLLKQTGNDKDVLATRVSYQLNLTGPSMTIQTACSTSLVAVHVACQSLISHESDMALAGGVTIEIPHKTGYVYREGEILSRDGHCRAFDADASGTVFGSGAGVVVLRRLADAVKDGDCIHAVIRGTAINNDGSRKVGYLAPSVSGQADVIAEALAVANVDAESISYIETHGTGTRVGDPIEITALTQAFRRSTNRRGFCAIGSLKTNIGHLDSAAGVAGLIKTVLALENKQIPPSLNFSKPNPLIDFDNSPFYVNTQLAEWNRTGHPLRAGVTSLGIGGTNAHVILEEAPLANKSGPSRPWQLLTISAKTASALESVARNLAGHLEDHPELQLPDVAYTSHLGRKAFSHRRAILCQTRDEAIDALRHGVAKRVFAGCQAGPPGIAFLFPGQGSQYANMARGVYEADESFRAQVDLCAKLLMPKLGFDLRGDLFPSDGDVTAANARLAQTAITQPALFVIEFALAKLWVSWGIRPSAMIGHSLGEFVAACLSGVLSLEDALSAVSARGRLMQSLPPGAMLAVAMPEAEACSAACNRISLAAINASRQCVLSGPTDAVNELKTKLSQDGVLCHRLNTSHAFHSDLMEPIIAAFTDVMRSFALHSPSIPYISNVTGTWIKPEEATDPGYWARHLRQTVRFSAGLQELLQDPSNLLLEVGPGRVLSGFATSQIAAGGSRKAFCSLRSASEAEDDMQSLMSTLARIWVFSGAVNWFDFHAQEQRQRVPLPTYPFERKRFWIEAPSPKSLVSDSSDQERPRPGEQTQTPAAEGRAELSFFSPAWKKSRLPSLSEERTSADAPWLIFLDPVGLGARIGHQLAAAGLTVMTVKPDEKFTKTGEHSYTIRPGHRQDYDALIADLVRLRKLPRHIIHLWSVIPTVDFSPALDTLEQTQDRSFYSLLFLVQAIGVQGLSQPIALEIVSNNLLEVAGSMVRRPERALLMGPCRVIPKEYSNIRSHLIDVILPGPSESGLVSRQEDTLVRQIIAESFSQASEPLIAYRGDDRWVQTVDRTQVDPSSSEGHRLRRHGVYVITGGLGEIGLVTAKFLAQNVQAKLVLVGRSGLPPKSEWDRWLAAHNTSDLVVRKIRQVQEIEGLGAEVLVTAGDVTSPADMNRVIVETRTRFGRIHGVIHAAGILNDGLIQLKGREAADHVLAPKVKGTLVLDDALKGISLDFVVLFSSISSFAAPIGQVDYVAANAFLDVFATSQKSKGQNLTLAINWARWKNLGMGAHPAKSHPAGPSSAGNCPLLTVPSAETPDTLVYDAELSFDDHWILNEHRLRNGDALFPGTGYIELIREAISSRCGAGAIQLQNLSFNTPFVVQAGKSMRIQIRFAREGAGFAFSVMPEQLGSGAGVARSVAFATGSVLYKGRAETQIVDVQDLLLRCGSRKLDFGAQGQNLKQARHIDFGPRWRSLKQVHFGDHEALSLVEFPPEFTSELDTLQSHPALLDAATGSAIFAIPDYDLTDDLYVPVSYKSVTLFSALPCRCYCHIRSSQTNSVKKDLATFDLTLIDGGGRVVAEISEFTVRRLRDTAMLSVDFAVRQESDLDPAEAVTALATLLAADPPAQVAVAPPGLEFSSVQNVPALGWRQSRNRSPLVSPANDHAGPRDEVEQTLTEWWQELLGAEHIGIHDDFLDLGGYSLLAVRLLARIEKKFKKTIPLHHFLQGGTIESLAALIRLARQEQATAIVPLNEHGTGPGIYCLGPIGGYVAGFRHLAKALGSDHKVYGIQPPPEKRALEFSTSIEDVAAYYVRQLVAFQREGPYILGGWSVGSAIALEMAQQLSARGDKVDLVFAIDGGFFNTRSETPAWSPVYYWKRLYNLPLWMIDDIMTNFSIRRLARRAFVKVNWLRSQALSVFGNNPTENVSEVNSFLDTTGYPQQDVDFMHGLYKAFRNYVPKQYSGRVVLYFARTRPILHLLEVDRAWQSIARNLEIVRVPGTHVNLVNERNSRVIAADLRQRLASLKGPDASFAEIDATRASNGLTVRS